jgi:outer membrane receptor protein involved in Fe transport
MRASLVVIAVLLAAVTSRAAEVTRAPELVSSVPPILPDDMPKDWRGGSVGLSLTLDDQGLIMRVDVVTSLGPQADWAALGAATQFVFSPAEIDGKPAPVVIGYTLVFEPRARVTTVEAPPTTESAAADPAKTFTLTGRVRRAGSVEPLPFAEVSISLLLPGGMTGPSSTTNTDADGRFALPPTVEGPYRLEVGTESYEPLLDEQYFDAGKRHDLDIALKPRLANAFETVVQRQRGEPPVSRVTLSRDEVRAIPGTYGDALRVIESLPGVARAPLLGGALMVRGGYPADTAIHFEGVPIPVLYHFGGFTSVVNSAFIENITFMPGGFPVRYGNATAGIVDVQARALDEKTFVTHVDVDLFDFGFFFGGHVTPKLGDVLDLPELRVGFAGRRSHAEIPANLVLSGAQAFGAALPFLPVPLYYDYQLKVESDVTSSSTLSLFLFGAEDSWAIIGEPPPLGTDANGDPLDFADVLNTFLGNRFHRLLGSWELKPLPGVTNTLRPYIGLTRRGLLSDGIAVPLLTGTSLDSPTEETNWGLRDELTVRMTPWLRGLVGFEHHGAAYSAELLAGADFLNVDAPSGVSTRANASLSTAAVYGELQLGPMAGLSATPGVRAELSSLTFEDADGLTPYNGKSKSVVDGWTIDPRVTLRYVVTPALALKGSAGTFHQRPRSQSAALDGDGDVLSPPAALQVIGGFEAKLTDDVSLDAQVYGVNRLSLIGQPLCCGDGMSDRP